MGYNNSIEVFNSFMGSNSIKACKFRKAYSSCSTMVLYIDGAAAKLRYTLYTGIG